MKKKLISNVLAVTLIATSYLPVFADNKNVITDPEKIKIAEQRAKEKAEKLDLNIFIDGKELTFTKEENLGMPFIDKNGRTLVPLRKPIEMSGNTVVWDNKTKTATITTNDRKIMVKLNDEIMLWQGSESDRLNTVKMDTEAVIKDGRVYIPLRAVFESMGLKVRYNKDTKTISALNQDGKVWDKEQMDKDFPNLNKDLNKVVFSDGRVKYGNYFNIDTIKLDNSLQDKLKLGENDGTKWIEVHNQNTQQLLALIKDGKIVYEAKDYTTSSYGKNYSYWAYHYEQTKDGYDITLADAILLYEYSNPVAILVENPFKK